MDQVRPGGRPDRTGLDPPARRGLLFDAAPTTTPPCSRPNGLSSCYSSYRSLLSEKKNQERHSKQTPDAPPHHDVVDENRIFTFGSGRKRNLGMRRLAVGGTGAVVV